MKLNKLKRVIASAMLWMIIYIALIFGMLSICRIIYIKFAVQNERKIFMYHARHYYDMKTVRPMLAPTRLNPHPVAPSIHSIIAKYNLITNTRNVFIITHIKTYKRNNITIKFDNTTQTITYYFNDTIYKTETYDVFLNAMLTIHVNEKYIIADNPLFKFIEK